MDQRTDWYINGVNLRCTMINIDCNETVQDIIRANTQISGNIFYSRLNITSAIDIFHNAAVQCRIKVNSKYTSSQTVYIFLQGKC